MFSIPCTCVPYVGVCVCVCVCVCACVRACVLGGAEYFHSKLYKLSPQVTCWTTSSIR